MSHVRIVMTDHGRGEVFVDGQQLDRVRAIQFEADAAWPRTVNTVVLTLVPEKVDIECPAEIIAADATWKLRLTRKLRRLFS